MTDSLRDTRGATPAAAPEPWLRGPVPDVPPLLQPVAHALTQAAEDAAAALADLDVERLHARPGGAASCAFHARHAAGSLDRLFTYARGDQLDDAQRAALRAESAIPREVDAPTLVRELDAGVSRAIAQLRRTPESVLREPRGVGRAQLPSTVLGLLFHAAEHTQRHVGQLISTSRIVRAAAGTGADVRSTLRVLFARELRTLRREVERYPDDEAPWRALPGVPNTGGTLVLHLAGNLQHYVGTMLSGSRYRRDRDAEFARRGVPREALAAEIDAALHAVEQGLATLDASALDAPYPEPFEGGAVRTRDFLLHLHAHLAYHLGQVDVHRRAVTGDASGASAIALAELPRVDV
jgi:uncharacterized damage-inducible protein DinB